MIAVLCCNCGGSEGSARAFLQKAGYKDWLTIPVQKGKDKSRSFISTLTGYPEGQMLDQFLRNASKFIVILGWNGDDLRWADISHNPTKSKIEAQVIVDVFA